MTTAHSDSIRGTQAEIAPSNAFATFRAYVALTKPRIMVLLLFTAYCAMIAAHARLPEWKTAAAGLLGLALSSGGAAAVNMWYDRDIDALMRRTAARPVPVGMVRPGHALTLGIILGVASIAVLAVWNNWLTAALAGAGYLYYAIVYTMWLKRRTPQNIVIGGGAGAFPPLVGWAAVSGHLSWTALLMFAVIFLWTPPHFWGLALYKNDDYVRAGIPMMPVVRGETVTRRQMVGYAVLLFGVSIAMGISAHVGVLTLGAIAIASLLFLASTVGVWREPSGTYVWAKRTFFGSLIYLPLVLTLLVIGVLV